MSLRSRGGHVIIVGAGPTGLMLARELRLAGDAAAPALREALADWFGTPLETTVPIHDPRS